MSLENLIVNRYLTLEDDEFVLIVDSDIRHFLQNCSENSILLFPPVNNYRRFLIHKVSESISNEKNAFALATFSIGNGALRRTVVCFQHQLLIDIKSNKYKSNEEAEYSWRYLKRNSVPKYNRRYLEMGVEGTSSDYSSSAASKGISKPHSVYVPPAARKHTKVNDNSDNLATGELAAFQPITDQSTVTNNCEGSTKTSPIDDLVNCQEDASKGSSKRAPTSRTRRPDRAVYVPPRAKRSLTTPPSSSSSSSNNHQKTNPSTVNSQRPVDTVKLQSKSIDLCENSNSSVELSLPLSELTTTTAVTSTVLLDSPIIVSDTENIDTSVIKPLCDLDPRVGVSRSKRNSECLIDPIGTDENSTKEISRNLQQQSLSGCGESLPVNQVPVESGEQKQEEQGKTTVHKNQKNLTNLHKMSEKSGKKSLTIENAGGLATVDKEDKEEKELRRASQEIKKIKQTFKSDVLEIEPTEKHQKRPETLPSPEEGEDFDDWDSKFDDNGDCLDPKMITELTQAVGKVTIEKPKSDYKVYQMKQDLLKDEEFPHVLEVSNFPVEFKTQDLMMLFSPFKESGFDIKWVDDTHALAVFSSAKVAAEVLSLNHSFIKLKPLGEATLESRTKAKKCSNSLQPYRQRPETCAALARRLVTGALGVRLKTAREERENERRVLREAKERKLLAAKQREEIWEG